ncbi:MAG: hypothetical protein RLZZ203_687 [Cyanobacteriota bacterium]|jgi:hypothetical protein
MRVGLIPALFICAMAKFSPRGLGFSVRIYRVRIHRVGMLIKSGIQASDIFLKIIITYSKSLDFPDLEYFLS